MHAIGQLCFDDIQKRIVVRSPFGWRQLDDEAFATICSNIILGKTVAGYYKTKDGELGLQIDEHGNVNAAMDIRRIELVDFK